MRRRRGGDRFWQLEFMGDRHVVYSRCSVDHAVGVVVALVGRRLRAAASCRCDCAPLRPERVAEVASRGGSSTTWVHTTELYSTDIRSTAHTLAFIVGRFGGFASGYVVENANSIPFATIVLIIMAALSALGTLTLRETMGERLS